MPDFKFSKSERDAYRRMHHADAFGDEAPQEELFDADALIADAAKAANGRREDRAYGGNN